MNRKTSADAVFFRPTEHSDLNSVLSIEQNPENSPFIRQWSKEQHAAAVADGNVAHLVISTPSDGTVGYLILVGLENADKSIEFKRIAIAGKGRGFGRAAVRYVKKLVFDQLGVHRLWLEVVENNYKAGSLYLSEGFTEEGMHRESLKQGEAFVSLKVMSILEHEYRKSIETQ